MKWPYDRGYILMKGKVILKALVIWGMEKELMTLPIMYVFIIKGIKLKFKQPICYAFSCEGGAKWSEIKYLVSRIIEMLIDFGLKPIATVCDQATTNVIVLNSFLIIKQIT